MENTPYIKLFDANGNIQNPITKENPYINQFPNRRQRRNYRKTITLQNPLNGNQTILKVCGNNRANTSSRKDVESRFNSVTSRKFLGFKK